MIKKQVFFLIFLLITTNSSKAEILTVEVISEHKNGPVLSHEILHLCEDW